LENFSELTDEGSMSLSEEEKERFSNSRTEYTAIEAYHRSLVHYRFIIVGSYFAGIGFLAKTAIEAKSFAGTLACGYALLLTICAWMLEWRTRALYRLIARRGEQIEHEIWGYRSSSWYDPMWSCQYKTEPEESDSDIPSKPKTDVIHVTLIGKLPSWLSNRISHSTSLDLMYFGSLLVWVWLLIDKLGYELVFK
jgi:hypothetical protein